jgi:hypothetical protein
MINVFRSQENIYISVYSRIWKQTQQTQTDPTDPADPTDPTDPTDPSDPTETADPLYIRREKIKYNLIVTDTTDPIFCDSLSIGKYSVCSYAAKVKRRKSYQKIVFLQTSWLRTNSKGSSLWANRLR